MFPDTQTQPPQMPDQSQAYLTPEVAPNRDREQPLMGPNMAENVDLATEVTKYLIHDFWLPYVMQQMTFWEPWRRLDEAWRAQMQAIDLDLQIYDQGKKALEAGIKPNQLDGFTLKVSPTDFHKQTDMLLKMGLQISFQEGLPVGAVLGDYVYESLYNPNQQTVDAANDILQETAIQCQLKQEWRKNFHSFVTYGCAWGLSDLKRSFEDAECRHTLSPDSNLSIQQLVALRQKYGRPEARLEQTPSGVCAVFLERRVKEFVTSFEHLDIDAVFTDLTMPCNDMDKHPCPWMRKRVGEYAIEQNAYDPEKNPLGFVNIDTALHNAKGQYVFQQIDEGPIRQRLEHRYGNTGQNQIKSSHMMKQLWTAWPMLRISDSGQLDMGEGCDCPTCGGSKQATPMTQDAMGQPMPGDPIECPTCVQDGQATGKVHPPLKRYIAQFYGGIYAGPMTCIRLQEMPKKQRIPLIFAADMIEDTAGAIPMSKGEVVLNDLYILAEYTNIELVSSRYAARRGWFVHEDSPALGKDFTKPDVQIPTSNAPGMEVARMDANSFDERLTLSPIRQECSMRVESNMGVTNVLQGEPFAGGRRPMGEVGNAIDQSKTPIVVLVDGYNEQMMGARGWAGHVIANYDLWGDPDFIRAKTGREFFGEKMRFETAVGEEFLRKLTRIQNERYLLEAGVNNPVLMSVMPQIAQKLMDDMGMTDVRVGDGGMKKAQQDGMRIVTMILGDGAMLPALPDDPHEIYLQLFTEAARAATQDPNDYWYGKVDGTMPILMQRIQMQQFYLQQQQIQQFQQQLAQQQAIAQAGAQPQDDQGGGKKAPPKKGSREAPTTGGAIQGMQGGNGGMAQ